MQRDQTRCHYRLLQPFDLGPSVHTEREVDSSPFGHAPRSNEFRSVSSRSRSRARWHAANPGELGNLGKKAAKLLAVRSPKASMAWQKAPAVVRTVPIELDGATDQRAGDWAGMFSGLA